jgi:hypothetical protein
VDDAYTDQDVYVVARVLWAADWPESPIPAVFQRSYRDKARAVLDALTAAGWHKPPDTEGG